MRILKYLFLLFLLSLVTLTIFVATQKGEFTLERSKIINSPRAMVFNYVNDTKNWEDWSCWATEDPEIKVEHSITTSGKGSYFSWQGKNGNGDIQTISIKENNSIVQKMNYNGNNSVVFMGFKDTVGGTKVTYKTTGKMDFSSKVLTFFNRGTKGVAGIFFEKSLENLNKKLDYERNTFSAKVNGILNIPESFYLAQTFTSENSNIAKNSEIIFPKIINYCKKNNIPVNGKPFIIYHTYDTINKLSKISICIPIKDSISTAPGNSISLRKQTAYQAVKTTLTGDYTHLNKALDKTKEYFATNYLSPDTKFYRIEKYQISKTETKNPSKWITEIFSPIRLKIVSNNQLPEDAKAVKIAPATKLDREIPSEF